MFRPPSLPEPLVAVLGDVRGWTEGPLGTSPDERAAWVVGLQQLRDAVDAVMLGTVASFDAAGDGEVLHGAASTQSWLRGALGVAPGEASERVRLARASRSLLDGAVANMAAGDMTYDHVRAVERAVRHVPQEHQRDAAKVLTELATQSDVTAVRTAGRHLRFVTDPDGTLRDAERQFERRHLTLSPLLDGMTAVEGLLDPESAALFSAALEPFLVPHGSEDLRSAAQRRADGLVEIVRAAVRPPAAARDRRRAPAPAGDVAGAAPCARCPAAGSWSGCAPASCLRRTRRVRRRGDASPAVTGRDPGRARPDQPISSPPGQRRFLAVRDGGCRFPRCDRAPAFTDAHHVQSWLDGGRTDVVNGLLLCRFHHRLVHEGGWTIHVGPEGAGGPVTFQGPRDQRLVSRPRGP